ncbi:hypothetical protein MTO96_038620 [Rhipicephalus appendiculatus]
MDKASDNQRASAQMDDPTIPMDALPPYPRPPSTQSSCGALHDTVFTGASNQRPLRRATGDHRRHREYSPIPALRMVLFFLVVVLLVYTLVPAGVIIMILAYTNWFGFLHIRHGMLCILAAGVVVVIASAFGVFHKLRYHRPPASVRWDRPQRTRLRGVCVCEDFGALSECPCAGR